MDALHLADSSPVRQPTTTSYREDSSRKEHEAWMDDLRAELKEHLKECSLVSSDHSKPSSKSSPKRHHAKERATTESRKSRSVKPASKERLGTKEREHRHSKKTSKPVKRKPFISKMTGDDGYGAILEINTTESEEDDPTYVSTMTEYYQLSTSESDSSYGKPYTKVTWPQSVRSHIKQPPTSRSSRKPRKVIDQTYNIHKLGDFTRSAPSSGVSHRWVTDDFDSQYWYRVEIEKCSPDEPKTPPKPAVRKTSTKTKPSEVERSNPKNYSSKDVPRSTARDYSRSYLAGNRAYAPSDWQETISQTYESLMTDDFKLLSAYKKASYMRPEPAEYTSYQYTPEPKYSSYRSVSQGGYRSHFDDYRDFSPSRSYSRRTTSRDYDVYSPSRDFISGGYGYEYGGDAYDSRPAYEDRAYSPDYQPTVQSDYAHSSAYDPYYEDFPSLYVWDTSDYYEYPLAKQSTDTDSSLREWKVILQEVKFWRDYVSASIR